ncbi:zinc finger MYM-type protein 2-like [Gigantopelta aegis]|uniref:zinc finger MYM-type protein 2-like n=1 Tax=Gigantopelta aegis TaxID=1735272 RepID=UPI001B88CF16|nr:zinc finger MYM-type protein 2-like [Gigantopelta aegis]
MKCLRDSAFSTNTENKSTWAVKLFNSWINERNNRNLRHVPIIKKDLISLAEDENELNTVLMCFVTEVRNMKGAEYRGNTLYEIVSSLQYYQRRNDKPVNFLDEACYAGLRSVLDARMKEIARKGIGISKRQAQIISEEQEDILWRKQFLGEDTPRQILDTLVYLIGLNFTLRTGDEHRFLRVGSASQSDLLVCSNGEKSLKYTEDISKTNQGGLKHRKLERKSVTVSENHDFPERCLVRLFEKYISLREHQQTWRQLLTTSFRENPQGYWTLRARPRQHL